MTIGDSIKKLREQRGWSFYDLAARARLTPQCVYLIETGKRKNPRANTKAKLCMALSISIEELFK